MSSPTIAISIESSSTTTSRDILLSSEERFEIWNVKKEERPYLLQEEEEEEEGGEHDEYDGANGENHKIDNDDDDDDENIIGMPPMLDGCDIPAWRKQHFVSVSSYTQGILNVGSGCPMLRREAQLPTITIPSRSLIKWNELQKQLLVKPPKTKTTNTAIRLTKAESSCQLAQQPYPWFEKQNIPAILEGCTDDWRAMETCTWDNLVKEFGHYDWRFSDTHGACMTLETYTKYVRSIEGLTDDAPLAVYDSQLHTDERISLLNDYQVPKCFAGFDLFQDVLLSDEDEVDGEENDNESNCSLPSASPPPYRWILMGPARSGTGLHIDPLGTHAWVTIVEGCKRWVLFPPDTNHHDIGMQEPQIPSSIWFANYYSKVMPKYPNAIEVLQFPGETVYVPAGWPHLVLNLMDTVAITQNYATEYPSMDRLINAVQEAEPDLFHFWLPKLQNCRPDLFQSPSSSSSPLQDSTEDKILSASNSNKDGGKTITMEGGGGGGRVDDDEKKEG